ncbi:lipid A export permease/ATP-binding protein MsbA [Thermodesulfobacteriota bacterium]
MRTYRWLLTYVAPYRNKLLIAMISMIVVSAMDSSLAYLVKDVVDKIFLDKKSGMLKALVFAVMLIFFAKGMFWYLQTYLMQFIGNRVITDLRRDLYRHIQNLSFSYFQNSSTGYIMSRLTNDVNQVSASVTSAVTSMLKEGFLCIGLIFVIFYMDWKLASISILTLPLTGLMVAKLGKRIRKYSRRTQHSQGTLSALIQESIVGNNIVKAFGMEEYENERFNRENERLFSIIFRMATVAALFSPLMESLGGIAAGAIIWVGGYKVITGESTTGEFFSFMTAMFMLYRPIKGLSRINFSIQQGLGAGERILEVFDTEPEVLEKPGAIELGSMSREITFRDVRFRYEKEWVIKGIDLKVQSGEIVAFAGMSGGGKTTLMNLIPRFYDVVEGTILIDGIDIQDVTLRSLRSQIAIVTQQTILFNDTIRNNIAYGSHERSDEEVVEAAMAANAHEFIQGFPVGYETIIGEQGVKLSGGQRQRLSIARAILKNAPILILDEATSSLDTESEKLVQDALERLMVNRTTLVIAHRLSTIRHADRIVVIVDGKVVEEGGHEELLSLGGEYSKLYKLQFSDQEESHPGMVPDGGEA